MNTVELKEIARNIRMTVIEAVHAAGSGHPGGSLSAADIMTVLYFDEMNIDPKNPQMVGGPGTICTSPLFSASVVRLPSGRTSRRQSWSTPSTVAP